ncbi:MAG: flagellar biosynthesis protein FliQ [Clostridiales bacterium]
MNEVIVVDIAQGALKTIIMLAGPLLGVSLIVGLAVSVFQATTQIQEQTLTFVPKILAIMISIAIFGSWMLRVVVEYTVNLYSHMNDFIK